VQKTLSNAERFVQGNESNTVACCASAGEGGEMSRINGWDERDYRLWSEIRSLPNYGLVAGEKDNPMLARKDVEKLLEEAAKNRFNDAHHKGR
jgi:hypothetical protein